jgi:outer membrane protein insertion porin family
VEGNFSPHEAFPIGGTNSVRGYKEGAVGSGRSYAIGSGEVSCRMVSFLFLFQNLMCLCCLTGPTWLYVTLVLVYDIQARCYVMSCRVLCWQHG